MDDKRRKELEGFFSDLQKWDRMVLKSGPELPEEQPAEHQGDKASEEQIFIRLDCETVALGGREDAKLA